MAKRKAKIERVEITLSSEEIAKYDEARRQVMEELPPKPSTFQPAGFGIPFYDARVAKGLSWYAVAKAAGIPEYRTVKEIELGHDVKLSSLNLVAAVLGLRVVVVAA